MTRVISNGNTALHRICTILHNQICQPLCCRPYGKTIHTIESSPQNAAQTGCTKGQRRKKTILNCVLITANRLQLSTFFFRQRRRSQPAFIFSHIIHHDFTSYNCRGIQNIPYINYTINSEVFNVFFGNVLLIVNLPRHDCIIRDCTKKQGRSLFTLDLPCHLIQI